MVILIDAFGGDNAPLEPIKGAVMAKATYKCDIALVGNIKKIKRVARTNGLSLSGIQLYHAEDAVMMQDNPLVIRSKPTSSLRVGFNLLKTGKVDAFISAGNTGAVHTGASLYVGRCENIRRAAIATILPLENPVLLIDSGANANPTPEHLCQFAVMGSIYMQNNMSIKNPRVGLLNIGTEENKGCDLQKNTFKLLSNMSDINFVGNVEANSVTCNTCDVIVADGFSGNILLKAIEGTSKLLLTSIKNIYKSSMLTSASYLTVRNHFKAFRKRFSASTHGGAPLLGICKPVIKAHGSANDITFFNAVKQAMRMIEQQVIEKIQDNCNKSSE